jgi:hypothetical protein
VQSGIVDGDASVEGKQLDKPLIGRVEFGGAGLVGQVEVADRPPLRGDRDAEERRHRRVVRWEPELSGWAAMFGIRQERASRMISPSRPRPRSSGPIAARSWGVTPLVMKRSFRSSGPTIPGAA